MPDVPQKVLDLIETFERNADEYRAADFNEANLRIQFINPLFKALGWDMDNAQGRESRSGTPRTFRLKFGS